MSDIDLSKGKKRHKKRAKKTRAEEPNSKNAENFEGDMAEGVEQTTALDTIREGQKEIQREIIKEIVKEMQHFKNEVKKDLSDIKEEIMSELDSVKKEVEARIAEMKAGLAEQETRATEAERRVEELEEWKIDAENALLRAQEEQRLMRELLTDQEGRSRRCNLRIFGLREGAEGGSVPQFIERLLRDELALPPTMELQIQRAHRALLPRPGADAAPRSIVVNFLQYTVKETVLREAWKKKVRYQDRPIYFDNDYATEVVKKRKEYIGIKKALKERGIRFQTPMTKIQIHWEDGPRTYENAAAAAGELSRRGIPTRLGETRRTEEGGAKPPLGHPGGAFTRVGARARNKLQGFTRRGNEHEQ